MLVYLFSLLQVPQRASEVWFSIIWHRLGGSPGSLSYQSLYWRGVEAFGLCWCISQVQERKVEMLVEELSFLEDSVVVLTASSIQLD